MNSKYLCLGALAIGGVYLYYRLFSETKKKTSNNLQQGIIYLVDGNIDHLFTLKDLVSPCAGAFDKPFELCKMIGQVPENVHIKIVICTYGGAMTNCEKILKKLKSHPAGYTAYIKNECYSAGAVIALGAKEIVMKKDSCLGKIDPQVTGTNSSYPAIIYDDLPENCIDSHTIAQVRICSQVLHQMEQLLDIIFGDNIAVRTKVREQMVYSNFPHSKTFDIAGCKEMGLSIREPNNDELPLFED